MKKKINTILVGLGKVGFEYDLKKKNYILSHAKSIIKNKKLKLLSAVDINKKKIKNFEKIYKLKASNNLSKTIEFEKPELVVISVNSNQIYKTFKIIKNYNCIKYVILEKPGALNYKQLLQIYSICQKNRIYLFINYNRAYFDKFLSEFKFLKKTKNFKIIYKYSRGLLNSASHFLNLVFHFLKNPKKILIIKKISHTKNDMEADVLLTFNNGEIYLLSSPAKNHVVNEAVMFSENFKKTIDLNNSKIVKYKSKKYNLINNHKLFFKNSSITLPNRNNQSVTLELILNQISKRKNNKNFKNANLRTLKTLDKIKLKSN